MQTTAVFVLTLLTAVAGRVIQLPDTQELLRIFGPPPSLASPTTGVTLPNKQSESAVDDFTELQSKFTFGRNPDLDTLESRYNIDDRIVFEENDKHQVKSNAGSREDVSSNSTAGDDERVDISTKLEDRVFDGSHCINGTVRVGSLCFIVDKSA